MDRDTINIGSLSPYLNTWNVKAKVVSKSKMKENQNPNKRFFSIVITDAQQDSMDCKFWGTVAVKWYDKIEVNKVYLFSNGKIAPANKYFNITKHDYDIVFNDNSEINEIKDNGEIKIEKKFSFVSLRDIKLAKKETPLTADIIGVVKHKGKIMMQKTKQGTEVRKQVIVVVDDTKHSFEIVFWEESTALIEEELQEDQLYIFTNISVRTWNDTKSGTFSTISTIEKIDTLKEDLKKKCMDIAKWYNETGKFEQFTNMRNVISGEISGVARHYPLSSIKDISNKVNGTYTLLGRVKRIFWKTKENEKRFMYPACPKCKKKVLSTNQAEQGGEDDMGGDDNDTMYSCMNCDDTNVKPTYQYSLNFVFFDPTGSLSLRAFGDEGAHLLGKNAESMKDMDDESLDFLFRYPSLYNQFKIVVRVNSKVYNGVERVNFNVYKIFPIKRYDNAYILELQNLLKSLSPPTTAKRTLEQDTEGETKKQKI